MAFRNLTIGILSMGVAACTATNPDGTSLPYRHSVSAYYNKFNTAVVKDNVIGVAWAIDSWFTDNGVAPLVIG